MAEDGDQEQEAVLFYARALYSYQPENDTEIGFEEAEVVSVIEDYGDGWWRAYGANNTVGKVPANYFEVLPNTEEEQPAEDGGYSYEYSAEGYDYGTGEGGDSVETPQPAATPSQPAQPTQASQPSQPAQPSISSSPAYAEQMKCWGDILETQKQEKQKLERQIADSELSLMNLRKEAFYFKQLDFILQEVLKLETEMDLDLDASVQFQRVQLALSRDVKAIKDVIDPSVKLENQHKKHIDDKLDDLNNKLNNSLQVLETCDKSRKTFYGDLTALQSFLEDMEKRNKTDAGEKSAAE